MSYQEPTLPCTKSKAIRDINEAWSLLSRAVEHLGGFCRGTPTEELYKLTLDESKRHDRYATGSRGITISVEAKYFAIKRLVEYLRDDEAPSLADYWHLQKSCYGAYAMVHSAQDGAAEIAKCYADNKALLHTVAAYDYVALIK
jgi:hypothetical protein